jgi:predicted phage terminase large subunit-like protein
MVMNEAAVFSSLIRTNFASFLWKCFNTIAPGTEFRPNWHIGAIAYNLMRLQRGQIKRLLINQPPRSLKSIAVSVAYVAWCLGHDPRIRIICASYSTELAAELHRQFRMVIGSDWYEELFPLMRLAKDTETEVVTTLGGGRLATSVGGSLTGRGADLIIVDDPLKAEEAQSDTARIRVRDWFTGTLLSRLNDKKHGQIVVLMQRLHEEDLSGHLLEKGNWTHLNLPAIAIVDSIVRIGPQRVFVRREGEVLHPERESRETLEKIKREIGSQTFSAQYQQEPIPLDGHLIKREWFQFYTKLPSKEPGDRLVQSWDTANMIGERNDFSVCTTWRKHRADFYLVDVFRRRLEYPDLLRKIRDLAHRFSADTILIEKAGLGQALLQELENDPPNGFVRPIGVLPKGDKKDRLVAQSARIESGLVHLPTEAVWLSDFLTEILGFPYRRHDDQVDSLSQFLYWATDRLFEDIPMGIGGLPIYGDCHDW